MLKNNQFLKVLPSSVLPGHTDFLLIEETAAGSRQWLISAGRICFLESQERPSSEMFTGMLDMVISTLQERMDGHRARVSASLN